MTSNCFVSLSMHIYIYILSYRVLVKHIGTYTILICPGICPNMVTLYSMWLETIHWVHITKWSLSPQLIQYKAGGGLLGIPSVYTGLIG